MKAKYTFQVFGEVKLDKKQMLPISAENLYFEFGLDDRNVVTYIEVVIPVEEEYFPRLVKTGPNRHSLVVGDNPLLFNVLRHLKGIEALMSNWGLRAIDKKNYKIVWLPENESEREKLDINNFSSRDTRMSVEEMEPLPFDILARSVISSWDGADEAIVTSFFRKGVADMEAQEYIDAIYDFYMILETRFCDGKWRGNQVKQKLKSSKVLEKAFNDAVQVSLVGALNQELKLQQSSNAKYTDFEAFFDYIVDLRGRLHHHSEKNPKAWDPNKPGVYQLEAVYLHAICNNIILGITWDYVDSELARSSYEKQCRDFIAKYS